MNGDPNTAPVAPPASNASDLDALVRLAGLVLSNRAAYGLQHPTTQAIAVDCYKALAEALARRGELAIELSEGRLTINGAPVARRNPLAHAFVSHLLERDVDRFTLKPGITAEEFGRLLSVLDREPALLRQAGGLAGAVVSERLDCRVDAPPVQAPAPSRSVRLPTCRRKAAPRAPDNYYEKGVHKFVDFILGFFGLTSLVIAGLIVLGVVLNDVGGSDAPMFLLAPALLAASVWIPVHFISSGRRFIAIGYLTFTVLVYVILPVLVLGVCFLALSRMN